MERWERGAEVGGGVVGGRVWVIEGTTYNRLFDTRTNTCLRPGVGLAMEKRSKTAANLSSVHSTALTEKQKRTQLLECARALLLLQRMEEFAPIILSRNLPGNFPLQKNNN